MHHILPHRSRISVVLRGLISVFGLLGSTLIDAQAKADAAPVPGITIVDWSPESTWMRDFSAKSERLSEKSSKSVSPAKGRDKMQVKAMLKARGRANAGSFAVSTESASDGGKSGKLTQPFARAASVALLDLGPGEQSTPLIEALAWGLDYDPLRIFNWVLTQTEYRPYNGLWQGAQVTALERAGNDFDLCVLLVSLLKQSDIDPSSIRYVQAKVTYTNQEIADWLGWDASVAAEAFSRLGIEATAGSGVFVVTRVFVTVTQGGVTHYLDPTFKRSKRDLPVTVAQLAPSYSASSLSYLAGGTYSSDDEIRAVSVDSFQGGLTTAASELVRNARATYHSRDARSLLGILALDQQELNDLPTALGHARTADVTWNRVPDNRLAKLRLELNAISQTYNWCDLADDVLNLRFDGDGRLRLYRDQDLEATETGAVSTPLTAACSIAYPVTPDAATDLSQAITSMGVTRALVRSGRTVVQHSFIRSVGRMRQAGDAQADSAAENPTSDWTNIATLATIGLQRAVHQENSLEVVGAMSGFLGFDRGSVWFYHQRSDGITVDGPYSMIGFTRIRSSATEYFRAFEAWVAWGSVAEHLCLDSVATSAGKSTVAVIESALRSGRWLLRLRPENWAGMMARVVGGENGILSGVKTSVTAGGRAFVPDQLQNPIYGSSTLTGGAAAMAQYFPAGSGVWENAWGTLGWWIDGVANGGKNNTTSNAVTAAAANTDIKKETTADSQRTTTGADPVDLNSGAFLYEVGGLKLGHGAEPTSLDYRHFYNSARRRQNTAGVGPGWTHSYDMYAAARHATDVDLRTATMAEVAPLMLAMQYLLDSVTAAPSAREMALRCLTLNWAGRQFVSSKMTVALGERRIEFQRLPDGTYVQSSSLPATFERLADASYRLTFRHGNAIAFKALDNSGTAGRAASILDPYGNLLSFTYANGLLQQVSDAYLRTLTFSYNGANLTSVFDSTNRTVGYQRGVDFRIADPDGGVTVFTAETGKILTVTDARSRMVIRNSYDAFQRVWAQEPLGEFPRATYIHFAPGAATEEDATGARAITRFDFRGRRISYQDAFGSRQLWEYDGADRLVKHVAARTVPGSTVRPTTIYTYDANHLLLTVTNPNGDTQTTTPDSTGLRPQSVTSFGEKVTTYTYHDFPHPTQSGVTVCTANPLSVTAPGGLVSTWTYDTKGRVSTYHPAAYASGAVDTYAYDAYGHLDKITHPADSYADAPDFDDYTFNVRGDLTELVDRRSVKRSFTYNNRRLRTSTTQWFGLTPLISQIFYDATGDIDYTLDASGRKTDHDYDALGHMLTQKRGPTGNQVTTLTNSYDVRNLLWTSADALANQTVFTYDSAQRRTDIEDPLHRHGKQRYDADNQPTESETPLGFITTTYFDARGLRSGVRDAELKTTSSSYDQDGRMTGLSNRLGLWFSWTYGDDARTATARTPRQQPNQPAASQSSTAVLNPRGLPATATEPSGQTTTFTSYDDEGRLLTRTDGVGTTVFTYWPNGLPKETIENGRTSYRGYDALNRLIEYRDGEGNTLRYDYHPSGELKEITYPDGVKKVGYTYDDFGRLWKVTDWAGRVTSYTYDDASRLTRLDRPNGTHREQEYDAAGQLRFVKEFKSDGSYLAYQELRYDDDGRIVWRFLHPAPAPVTLVADTLLYDDDNRLSSWNSSGVTFDADGNMTNGPLPSGTFGTYGYDARNRLTSAAGSGYRYTAEGARVQVTGTDAAAYVVDPNAALSRTLVRVKGGVTTYYVYGLGLLYEETAGATKTYHYDHLGSTLALTTDGLTVTDRWSYAPFGAVTSRTGSTDTSFQLHGEMGVMTDSSGLVCMRARYYNLRLMRFCNADPIGFAGGLNWYAFGGNNPMSFTDPLGLCGQKSYWAGQYWSDAANYMSSYSLGVLESPWVLLQTVGQGYAQIGGLAGEATMGQFWQDAGTMVRNPGATAVSTLQVGAGVAVDTVASFQDGRNLGNAVGGAAVGSVALPGSLSTLSNASKGTIGEATSLVTNLARGNIPAGGAGVGWQVPLRVAGRAPVIDWQFTNIFTGVTKLTESKFGTSNLSSAQRAAGPSLSVERWTYGFWTNVGAAGGAASGAAGSGRGP